jgi:hypothetical protein
LGHWWNDNSEGENLSSQRKLLPIVTFSTINHTWIVIGSNPGPCSELPLTNFLGYGMVSSENKSHKYLVARNFGVGNELKRKLNVTVHVISWEFSCVPKRS